MTMRKQFQIVEIDIAAVQGLVERAKGRMPKKDHELLQGLVDTLFTLMDLLRKGRTTLAWIPTQRRF